MSVSSETDFLLLLSPMTIKSVELYSLYSPLLIVSVYDFYATADSLISRKSNQQTWEAVGLPQVTPS